ncbi:MAG: hypothetical protein BMS9Abin07_1118 [Acidimicrobiia bacterium]|nr:MAG: hypothetical protein BMS9Abin07_1118 [Acidimicrobiia bacterium]
MNAEELARDLSEKTSLTFEQGKEAAIEAANWLKGMVPDEVSAAFGEFFDSASNLASTAVDAGKDAAKATGDVASDMLDKAKGVVPGQSDSTDQ